ncbi:FRG domain-containing protein [Methanobrevibacter curvatus]|uniref:FRG domain protein n=1 Tax=Methanobrevibacter curvatus TaxID=49547 RepID=A0A166APT8_9EURY|nr:FRG domain-containing protein [Methanobrevibacter curvatus]KZX12314.1 FRG domain protein [Methanobrevibacter curvatus]
MPYEDYVKTYNIDSCNKLFNIIQGKGDYQDIRENFIFRGVKNISYTLIPSVLRKLKDSKNYLITEFIEDSYRSNITLHNEKNKSRRIGQIDKYNNITRRDKNNLDHVTSLDEADIKKEMKILLKFLDYADKSGLHVPFNERIRENIHRQTDYKSKPEYFDCWPDISYLEIISLAQHYGLPTRALDWTYDYKVALYFAVIGVLDEEKGTEKDCLLWALNYKKFENNYQGRSALWGNFPLNFYRPEYNKNPNLAAQKGLFTILIDYYEKFDKRPLNLKQPLDKVLAKILDYNKKPERSNENESVYKVWNLNEFTMDDNEKIFYKFIIPGKIKSKILRELYIEGYSEEYLFPGYSGVALSIENRVKLDKKLNK